MFELLPEIKDNLIAVKMSGTVTAADYEQFMPSMEDVIARAAPAFAFVDWEDFDGWVLAMPSGTPCGTGSPTGTPFAE